MYSSFTQNHEFLTGMNYCVHACNINSMKVNVLGLNIYIIKKKLRVSGTRGMRQGGRLKMCSPHRLIMKERNFFWVLGKGVTLNWKNICIDNILYTVFFFKRSFIVN